MTKKCLYQCLEMGEVLRADDPFICPLHSDYLRVSLSLSQHDRALTKALLEDVLLGRKVLGEDGLLRNVPPKPVPEHIIREDDGSIRQNGTIVRWFTREQMLDQLGIEEVQAPPGKAAGKDWATAYAPPPDEEPTNTERMTATEAVALVEKIYRRDPLDYDTVVKEPPARSGDHYQQPVTERKAGKIHLDSAGNYSTVEDG